MRQAAVQHLRQHGLEEGDRARSDPFPECLFGKTQLAEHAGQQRPAAKGHDALTQQQDGGLNEEFRGEFARLAFEKARLVGQGLELRPGQPVGERAQDRCGRGGRGRWDGTPGGFGFSFGFCFATSVIPKIGGISRCEEPACSATIFTRLS